eukprot:1137470-Pelagomonas_calceolata.AAC.1
MAEGALQARLIRYTGRQILLATEVAKVPAAMTVYNPRGVADASGTGRRYNDGRQPSRSPLALFLAFSPRLAVSSLG